VVEAVNRARWLVVAGFLLLFHCAGAAQEINWAGIIEAAKPAVVFIETNKSYGSGAIISPDGYILTAAHVIEGASWITVTVEDTREYRASVVQADYGMDVAVLKIPASGLTWLKLGDSDRLRYEDEIRVLGYPLPAPTGEIGVGFVAVAGRIQGFRQRASGILLQHDAPAEGGHSGGPMIDARAEIVGVHVGFIPGEVERYRVAVAINEARRIIPQGAIPVEPSPVSRPSYPVLPRRVIKVPDDVSSLNPSYSRSAGKGQQDVGGGHLAGPREGSGHPAHRPRGPAGVHLGATERGKSELKA
jgi:S1-C subfamily serine protease